MNRDDGALAWLHERYRCRCRRRRRLDHTRTGTTGTLLSRATGARRPDMERIAHLVPRNTAWVHIFLSQAEVYLSSSRGVPGVECEKERKVSDIT